MTNRIQTDTLAFLISDVARLMQATLERRIADIGLCVTPGEARTLIFAAAMGGVPQAKIAERMRVDPMTVSGYLNRLEAADLVERVPDPADRRVKQIVVTGKADRIIGFLQSEMEHVQAHACRNLRAHESDNLAHLLKSLRLSLRGLSANPACTSAETV